MLLLTVCCGLMFSIVSASSNSETLRTSSNLSSNVTPGSKPCTLEFEDTEISRVVELFNNDLVHVVNISVSLSDTSHGRELLSDFHVQLMNRIGRELLFSLRTFRTFQWTLTVGLRDFELHASERQNDCIRNQTNVTEFTLETIQNIVRKIDLATNYDVWYSFKEISSGQQRIGCCHITKSNLLEWNGVCFENNSFVFPSGSIFWIVLYSIVLLVFLLCLNWLFFDLVSQEDFDVEYSKWYKLEESRISPSFIFYKIIWEEKGPVIACIRGCLLIFVIPSFWYPWQTFLVVLFYCILPEVWYLICCYLRFLGSTSFMPKDSRIEFFFTCYGKFLVWFGYDDTELREELKTCQNIGMIKMLTLLFNIKFWRKASKTVNQKIATFTAKHIKLNNCAFKFLAAWLCYAYAVFIYLLLVCTLPVYSVLGVFRAFLFYRFFPVPFSCNLRFCFRFLLLVCVFSLVIFLIFGTFILMPVAILSLLLGLFLNFIFFTPYFAFLSVLTFYCMSYWKSLEEKYLLLKQLIYEVCRDTQHVDKDWIPNTRLERNEKILPVVSKELYDKIREKLLPYDKNVFYLGVKMLCVLAFSFTIFQLIEMLRVLEVTGFVQVLTTASLVVMLHIFNLAALKTSEQMKMAWEEELKLNVKYMVEQLVREDSELAQTEVIIPWQADTVSEMKDDCEERVKLPQGKAIIHQDHDKTNEIADDNHQVNEGQVGLLQTDDVKRFCQSKHIHYTSSQLQL